MPACMCMCMCMCKVVRSDTSCECVKVDDTIAASCVDLSVTQLLMQFSVAVYSHNHH